MARTSHHFVNCDFTGEPVPDTSQEDLSPREYYDMLSDKCWHGIIVDQGNSFSTQTTGRSINTTNLETEQFIGI